MGWRSDLAVFGLVMLTAVTGGRGLEAAVSKGSNQQVQSRDSNQGGGVFSSPTRKVRFAIGGPMQTVRMASTTFRVQPGLLSALSKAGQAILNAQLDLVRLYAKTSSFGTEIEPQVWQKDVDPIFIWEPPQVGSNIAGYSYAIDAELDDTIDTAGTSWDVAQDPIKQLSDGPHTFSVKGLNSAGMSGAPLTFNIWIDTLPPVINSSGPTPGVMLNTLSPGITANVSEPHSGLDADGILLTVNGSRVSATFDAATGTITSAGRTLREGSNSIELRLTDKAGNAQTPLVWSVLADVTPPQGSLAINGGAGTTTSVYVTLNFEATDAMSGPARIMISNDPLVGFVEETYKTVRELWRLSAVRGSQTVYVKFVDAVGNVSEVQSAEIVLDLLAPETILLSGPAGITPERAAKFTFGCPEGNCVFSYAFDHEDWSDWSAETSATVGGLPFGNHYFKVKAARELNGIEGIQPDEEDPTPAERTWIVGVESTIIPVPSGGPIKLWRLD